MIQVNIRRNDDECVLTMEGHANGHLYVRCKNCKEMDIAFAVIRIGLLQLEKKYKNCIKINEFVA